MASVRFFSLFEFIIYSLNIYFQLLFSFRILRVGILQYFKMFFLYINLLNLLFVCVFWHMCVCVFVQARYFIVLHTQSSDSNPNSVQYYIHMKSWSNKYLRILLLVLFIVFHYYQASHSQYFRIRVNVNNTPTGPRAIAWRHRRLYNNIICTAIIEYSW